MVHVAMSHHDRLGRSPAGKEILMTEDTSELSALQQGWTAQHGSVLVHLRRSRGLLQAEVADLVGAPRSVVSNWETATRKPSVEQLQRLIRSLNVSAEAFVNTPQVTDRESVPLNPLTDVETA